MKVFVLLILPILITSKNFLIETKDSMEAKGEEVNTEDDTGMDYTRCGTPCMIRRRNKIKRYKKFCIPKGESFGKNPEYCKTWDKLWLVKKNEDYIVTVMIM